LSLWASNMGLGNGLTVNRYGGPQGATIVGRNMRGTDASPSATQAGDSLLGVGALGYSTDMFHSRSTALMAFIAEENFTNESNPTSINFFTTPSGSVERALRARITGSG